MPHEAPAAVHHHAAQEAVAVQAGVDAGQQGRLGLLVLHPVQGQSRAVGQADFDDVRAEAVAPLAGELEHHRRLGVVAEFDAVALVDHGRDIAGYAGETHLQGAGAALAAAELQVQAAAGKRAVEGGDAVAARQLGQGVGMQLRRGAAGAVELSVDVHQVIGVGEQVRLIRPGRAGRRSEATSGERGQVGVVPCLDARRGKAGVEKALELGAARSLVRLGQAGREAFEALGVGSERHQAASSQL